MKMKLKKMKEAKYKDIESRHGIVAMSYYLLRDDEKERASLYEWNKNKSHGKDNIEII